MATSTKILTIGLGLALQWFCCSSDRGAAADEVVLESVKPRQENSAVKRYGLTREDFDRISKTLPGIRHAVPIRTMPSEAAYGERTSQIYLIGTVATFPELDKLKLARGRFLSDKDVRNRNNVAVIDARTAQRLFPHQNPIGRNIRIDKHYFLIVGQSASPQQPTNRREAPGDVYVPITTMLSRYGDTVLRRLPGRFEAEHYELSKIRLVLEPGTDTPRVETAVRSLVRAWHDSTDFSVNAVRDSKLNRQK